MFGCCDTCVDMGAETGGEGDRCGAAETDDACVSEKDWP